jgi:hypothetical protein
MQIFALIPKLVRQQEIMVRRADVREQREQVMLRRLLPARDRRVIGGRAVDAEGQGAKFP